VTDRPQARNRGAVANIALIFLSTAAVLAVAALATAIVVDPPALGWIGFAIACAAVVALTAVATLLVPRTRVSAVLPAVASSPAPRLLVIADADCDVAGICDAIQARLAGAVAVHLVVPVRVSHIHFLTNDESKEHQEAEETLVLAVGLLQQRRIATTGSVGTDKPLESMTDALGRFPATRVLLATPPVDESYWLERGLLAKARALTELPVTQAVVASARPVRSSAR
jgi:hypothetical protein